MAKSKRAKANKSLTTGFRVARKVRNPNPPPPPKEHQFKPGQSGNPGGRPKRVTEAYREWLEAVDPSTGLTNARLLANAIGIKVLGGDVSAAREIRQATEGERIRTWRDDIIDLLRDGTLTPEQVSSELGDDLATELIAASGIRRGESREAETAGDTTAES